MHLTQYSVYRIHLKPRTLFGRLFFLHVFKQFFLDTAPRFPIKDTPSGVKWDKREQKGGFMPKSKSSKTSINRFRSRSEHSLDSKGRLNIPSRFRDVLQSEHQEKLMLYDDGTSAQQD